MNKREDDCNNYSEALFLLSEHQKVVGQVSLDGKATGLLNGLRQLFQQFFIAAVGWNVNAIEAGVSFRKVIHVSLNQVNRKEAWAGSPS